MNEWINQTRNGHTTEQQNTYRKWFYRSKKKKINKRKTSYCGWLKVNGKTLRTNKNINSLGLNIMNWIRFVCVCVSLLVLKKKNTKWFPLIQFNARNNFYFYIFCYMRQCIVANKYFLFSFKQLKGVFFTLNKFEYLFKEFLTIMTK